MKIEQQVTSLELSKRLKALGVKAESLFYWKVPNEQKREELAGSSIVHKDKFSFDDKWFNFYSAFTVAELGEMFLTRDKYIIKTYRDAGEMFWIEVGYTENYRIEETQMFFGDTEADARAKMLNYLIKNKLITL